MFVPAFGMEKFAALSLKFTVSRAISPLPAQAGRLCLQRLPPSLTLGGSPSKTRSDANLDWPVLTAEK
jgi:hypothetical protein